MHPLGVGGKWEISARRWGHAGSASGECSLVLLVGGRVAVGVAAACDEQHQSARAAAESTTKIPVLSRE